jgi:hypothetical protein
MRGLVTAFPKTEEKRESQLNAIVASARLLRSNRKRSIAMGRLRAAQNKKLTDQSLTR